MLSEEFMTTARDSNNEIMIEDKVGRSSSRFSPTLAKHKFSLGKWNASPTTTDHA
jgi:hypothetical protein